jgi:2-polyprenyl-3-methyl-5-hydroxy-6-metoxy-1,4-benzoquinol methylase
MSDQNKRSETMIYDLIRSEVGDVRGKSLVHLLCYIGTDTLSWALLGAKVTGIDISPRSLHYARQLAAQMLIDADFIEADIMDVIDNVNRKFDIAFASTGCCAGSPISSASPRRCGTCWLRGDSSTSTMGTPSGA